MTPACFSDWELLGKSIERAAAGITYVVCPGTTFLGDPLDEHWRILVANKNTIIKCGEDGKRENNCIIEGGREHFLIGTSGSLELYGLTLRGAIAASIRNFPGGGNGLFEDCLWEENKNTGSFLEESGDENIMSAVAWLSEGNTFTFNRCDFVSNEAPYGAIFVDHSNSAFNSCSFLRNIGTANIWASAVSNSYSTTVSFVRNCFEENYSNGFGTVFLRHDTKLLQNYKNFGRENYVEQIASDNQLDFACTDAIRQAGWDGKASCVFFDELSCLASNSVTTAATQAPLPTDPHIASTAATEAIPQAFPSPSEGSQNVITQTSPAPQVRVDVNTPITVNVESPQEDNIGTIVGATIGGVFAVLAAIVGARCALKKK